MRSRARNPQRSMDFVRRLRASARGLALAALAAGCGPPPPPSLVLVTLDTLRLDHVGAYGASGGATPELDALARRGLVHEAAFTTMPTTAPAHASLFTGLHPHEHGVLRNGARLAAPLAAQELGTRLRERGYATAAFVTGEPMTRRAAGLRGFESYGEPAAGGARPGAAAVADALDWLDRIPQRPVFLWVHLYDPHSPYGGWDEKRRQGRVDPQRHGFVERSRFASAEQRAAMAQRYADGVREADAALGQLVAGVTERLDDPLWVVVSDHGEALDEHLDTRGYAYDHGEFLDAEAVRIALVLAGPGVEPGRSRGVASIRDLYTTLLAAAGIEDADARAADRRDLRRPVTDARRARIERHALSPAQQARLGAESSALVRTHAVAVADGTQLLVLGEDGAAAAPLPPGVDPALLADARDTLHARAAAAGASARAQVDPAVREALEQLGYVEGDAAAP